ncbi:unnamed protein product [Scytosiphon promiscuus]
MAAADEAGTPSTLTPSGDDEAPGKRLSFRQLVSRLPTASEHGGQPALKPMQMKVRLSFRTDIGGMSENQDNCFIWRHEPSGSFVIGVLDGHGRDVGRLAAHVVQEFMQDWLTRRWAEVKENPAEAFRTLFREAHESMLLSFREHLQGLGWNVKDNGGYLMKRRSLTQPWSCVHGGTSATLVALVEGRTLYTANVGDSSALLAMQGRRVEVDDLMQHSFWKDGGGEMEACREPGTVGDPALIPARAEDGFPCQTLLVTADHSPESVREFERMRFTHPSNANGGRPPVAPNSTGGGNGGGGRWGGTAGHIGNGGSNNQQQQQQQQQQTGLSFRLPSLLVVYDSPSSNKLKCSPVFDVDIKGTPRVTNKGRYYKNVRKEWASLVATPLSARFQDALAFTRSIGDFHLQTYGVSHVPDVMSLDLQQLFHREQGGDVPDQMLVCLVAASDGVWDNWLYADVSAFFLNPERAAEVIKTNSAERVTEAFMRENARRANANFGSQADNATCVACYLIVTLDA